MIRGFDPGLCHFPDGHCLCPNCDPEDESPIAEINQGDLERLFPARKFVSLEHTLSTRTPLTPDRRLEFLVADRTAGLITARKFRRDRVRVNREIRKNKHEKRHEKKLRGSYLTIDLPYLR